MVRLPRGGRNYQVGRVYGEVVMRIKYSILRSVETLTPFFFLLQETDLASNSKNTLKETYADASGNML